MAVVAGVDEAGRGPVIGPLVVCAFAIGQEREPELKKMGVKDSKLLEPGRREEIAERLRGIGKHAIKVITAEEITELMRRKVSLNDVEAKAMGEALGEVGKAGGVGKAIVDSPDHIAQNFERRIRKYATLEFPIACEHKADARHLVVGAASILAKSGREREIGLIKKKLAKHGIADDFGSGYPHDPLTVAFLKKHHRTKEVQEYIRHEWETAKRHRFEQHDLSRFV